jgi:hypothetical protein
VSWFGAHPDIPKSLAKAILPARACRVCVYRLRVRTVRILWRNSPRDDFTCPRCGLIWDVANTRRWVDSANTEKVGAR